MGFLRTSCSFTRYQIIETVPPELWLQVPEKLKQYSFQDIDNTIQERSWGWTNFDDMLDTSWSLSPPEKGEYIAFSLRLETRRIPPAVVKKHFAIALYEEKTINHTIEKKVITKERKVEIYQHVTNRLFKHFLPIPAIFDVVWSTTTKTLYFSSIHSKVNDLFTNLFTVTFELHLEPQTPYILAQSILDESYIHNLDTLESTRFV